MSSGPPEPNLSSPVPGEDEAWGDAGKLPPNEVSRPVVLPERRELKKVTVISRIESENLAPEAGDLPERIDEDLQPAARLQVREIDGGRAGKIKPERPDVPLHVGKEGSHAKAMAERWEIEGKEWSGKQTFPIKWLVLIAVAVIALIVVSLIMLPSLNRGGSATPPAPVIAAGMAEQSEQERDQLIEKMLLMQDDARSIYAKFATAKVVDDILPMLRNPKQVEPLVRAAGLRPGGSDAWRPGSASTSWALAMVEDMPYATLAGTDGDYRKFEAYFVMENGHLLMDWKATTGYGTASIKEMVQGQGDGSEIRGVLAPTVFYTMHFPENEYQSYQLASADGEDTIWCYARHDQPVGRSVARIFLGGGIVQNEIRPTKVTLKLARGPEGSLKNQWLIEDLLHAQWIDP